MTVSRHLRSRRRGSVMMEFVLAGIASVFLLTCTVALSYGMWNYHTLAQATHEATRYAAVHGKGCTYPGNTCTITVGTHARKIKSLAIGVPADAMNVTLTSESGAQTNCNPLTSCYTNTAIWPPLTNSDNQEGRLITISARYHFKSPLLFFWPGAGTQRFGTIVFPAASTQTILF